MMMDTPRVEPLAGPQDDDAASDLPSGSAPAAKTALIGANLVPLAGVLLFGWDLFSVMLVYWLENGVIGAFNVIKIAMARGPVRVDRTVGSGGMAAPHGQVSEEQMATLQKYAGASRFFLAPFFLVHYGGFWAVHGVFVFVLFSGRIGGPFGHTTAEAINWWGIAVTIAALAASHAVSFFYNFIGHREFEQMSPPEQMFQPYGRVFVLHIAIIGGGFLIMLLGQPLGALILLIVLKTGLDLLSHTRAHSGRGAVVQA
jgi:hypothetical protein